MILNYAVILSHRRSTTVSLETYPNLFICIKLRLIIKSGAHSSHIYHQPSFLWEIDVSVLNSFIEAYMFQVKQGKIVVNTPRCPAKCM